MSYPEVKNLSKADLILKLSKMGMSLDRTKHSKDYYLQLYLDKSNAKNKITRDKTSLNYEKITNRKRARTKSNDLFEIKENKYESQDQNYEEEEYEEDIKDVSGELLYQEEKEKNKTNKRNYTKRKERKNDEENNDYRESGIKITRLIRIRKKQPKRIKSTERKSETKRKTSRKDNKSVRKVRNVRRKILKNLNEEEGELGYDDGTYYYFGNKSLRKERYYPRNKDGTFKKVRKENNYEININTYIKEMKSAERKTNRKRNLRSYDKSKSNSKSRTKRIRNKRLNFSNTKNNTIEKSYKTNNKRRTL